MANLEQMKTKCSNTGKRKLTPKIAIGSDELGPRLIRMERETCGYDAKRKLIRN